jgi:UDP-glucose 4-epimerase
VKAESSRFYHDRTVLVTGGAGFIGSHLVDALVDLGARVRVIDDLSNGRRENIAAHLEHGRVMFVQASILNEGALARAAEGCSVVFHQAALGSVPASVERPLVYHDVNGTGTVRVLEAARRAGAKRFVYASSSSVYGDSPALPKIESMLPAPMSPYAASKLAGEHWVRAYAGCYGVSGVSLRYFNVFGARQRPDSQYAAVVPAFIAAARADRPPIIHGDGLQSRDFTHVANVVHANLLAGAIDRDLRGEAVNIACGERITLLELLEAIQSHAGSNAAPDFRPPRAGDVRHSQADISAARDLLGFDPVMPFGEGLRATLG